MTDWRYLNIELTRTNQWLTAERLIQFPWWNRRGFSCWPGWIHQRGSTSQQQTWNHAANTDKDPRSSSGPKLPSLAPENNRNWITNMPMCANRSEIRTAVQPSHQRRQKQSKKRKIVASSFIPGGWATTNDDVVANVCGTDANHRTEVHEYKACDQD